MGQKDLRGKLLEDYEDVFADIFNVLLFKENLLEQRYLKDGPTESIYKAENGNYREQRRDVLKEYMDSCFLEIGYLGIENQSVLDDYMPVRIMGYDYAKYRGQIDRMRKPLLPVITIVLNFSDKPWEENKSLHDIMNIPKKFEGYVQDYKVKIFDIAFLEDNVIESFTSDFKLLAKFFKNRRLKKEEIFSDDKINHVQEFLDFLAVFTCDESYREIKQELVDMEKEGRAVLMCNVAQAIRNEGIEKGIEALVQTLKELDQSNDMIIQKLMEKFNLSEGEAIEKVEQYWNSERDYVKENKE